MPNSLKRHLYFFVARYFRFWARFQLKRWRPTVIVVTGSAGKTTMLHLLEAQIGTQAHYSHHANSAIGIPFDILGLRTITHSRIDWIKAILLAPGRSFSNRYTEAYYVAEVDADRAKEAAFIAELLQPDITLWVSSLHTHTIGFDQLVKQGQFKTAAEAVAFEYGNLAAATKQLVLYDGDNPLMEQQMTRTKAQTKGIKLSDLKNYKLTRAGTVMQFGGQTVTVPFILPKATFTQVAMTTKLLDHLKLPFDPVYSQLVMPPGRSSILRGRDNITLIDSTYNNSNVDTLRTIIEMFELYTASHKWAVIGDMLEQGVDEPEEHAKIIPVLDDTHFERLILVGPRQSKYVGSHLSEKLRKRTAVKVFKHPKEVREYLAKELTGGETILFKGAGYLEALVEDLLADPTDERLLVRREPLLAKRRKEFGL